MANDDIAPVIQALLNPTPTELEEHLDEMRFWDAGFISATAFCAAAANWPRVREVALAEFRQCLADPLSPAMDSQLPVLGWYLAGANRDAAFLAPLLEGWSLEDDHREALFGDILTSDGPSLMALLACHSGAGIKQLEVAATPRLDIDANHNALPLEALALLVKEGIHSREAFDSLVRENMRKIESEEFVADAAERRQWTTTVLLDLGLGSFEEEIRGWFGRGLMDVEFFPIVDLETFEQCAISKRPDEEWHALTRYKIIAEDTYVAMEWMRRSKDDDLQSDYDDGYGDDGEADEDDEVTAPITRLEPKVGRNDPCPCGSGRKFKKCCGAL